MSILHDIMRIEGKQLLINRDESEFQQYRAQRKTYFDGTTGYLTGNQFTELLHPNISDAILMSFKSPTTYNLMEFLVIEHRGKCPVEMHSQIKNVYWESVTFFIQHWHPI